MPDRRRANCMSCGQPSSVVGPISWRGNCRLCGHVRLEQSIDEQVVKRGPMYRRWQIGIVAGVMGDLLDTSPGEGHSHS